MATTPQSVTGAALRVASRWATRSILAGMAFSVERSPRVDGAWRFKITDSKAPPGDRRAQQYFGALQGKTWPITDALDVAYVDFDRLGKSRYLHLVKVRPDYRGQGLASKLLKAFYKQEVPKGAAVNWGRILNPTAYSLFEKMEKERPDVTHLGSRFF